MPPGTAFRLRLRFEASGAGKSTLLKLCARLADPEEGCVRIDGHKLEDLDLKVRVSLPDLNYI